MEDPRSLLVQFRPMGVLDDAIREHLELKRKHGAAEEELERQEEEALGSARREVAQEPGDGEAGGGSGSRGGRRNAGADESGAEQDPSSRRLPVEEVEVAEAPRVSRSRLPGPCPRRARGAGGPARPDRGARRVGVGASRRTGGVLVRGGRASARPLAEEGQTRIRTPITATTRGHAGLPSGDAGARQDLVRRRSRPARLRVDAPRLRRPALGALSPLHRLQDPALWGRSATCLSPASEVSQPIRTGGLLRARVALFQPN